MQQGECNFLKVLSKIKDDTLSCNFANASIHVDKFQPKAVLALQFHYYLNAFNLHRSFNLWGIFDLVLM